MFPVDIFSVKLFLVSILSLSIIRYLTIYANDFLNKVSHSQELQCSATAKLSSKTKTNLDLDSFIFIVCCLFKDKSWARIVYFLLCYIRKVPPSQVASFQGWIAFSCSSTTTIYHWSWGISVRWALQWGNILQMHQPTFLWRRQKSNYQKLHEETPNDNVLFYRQRWEGQVVVMVI